MANNWTNEQLQAINKEGSNIIVSAGAGSGKTAVLTERVIRKLKEGSSIERLLILTFTNMAAKEMKDRIRNSLKEVNGLEEQLNLLDTAFITTFDSYALAIVKKYHYLLNISPLISICEASIISLEKRKILDKIFDRRYEEDDQLFIKLITDFCVKDDKEIKDYILKINDKLDMKYDKVAYLDNYGNNFFNDNNLDNIVDEYVKVIFNLIDDIKNDVDDISYYVDASTLEKLNNSLINLFKASNYNDLYINKNVKLPNLPKNSSEEAKRIKANIKNKIDKLNDMLVYENKDEIKNSILKTKDNVLVIISLLKELDYEITSFKEKNNFYEFNDIAKLAIKLVLDEEDVREEIKNSYDEIMVDEYQDTNDLQELFICSISNNNTYMVGDIKQSIYRFRNANSYIFKNKYDNYALGNGGIKIDLNKNFRSRSEVVDNINLIFNDLMSDKVGGANYKEDHQMVFGNITYNDFKALQNNNLEIYNYNYDNLEYSKEEIEIFIVANDIINKIKNGYQVYDKDKKTLRNATYSDFVILLDRVTYSDLYKKIFSYLNIPLTVYKDNIINNSPIFGVLKSIIGLIIKVYDKSYDALFKYFFVSVARSFLIEYKDSEIFDIVKNKTYKETTLYQKIKNIAYKIEDLAVNEIVDEIINEFHIVENIIKIGNVLEHMTNINYLKELSLSLANSGYQIKDLFDYLVDINDKNLDIKYLPNIGDENAVKLMTIHRSKGLEYSICYYNMLYKEFNFSDITDKFYYDNKYGIVASYYEEGINKTIIFDLVKDNYYNEEISEKIRLLYVALTRAKEKMIMVVNNMDEGISKNKFKSFRDVILSNYDNLVDNIVNLDISKLNLSKNYNYLEKEDIVINEVNKIDVCELNLENEVIKEMSYSKKSNKLYTKEEKELMAYGEKVHYILEVIDLKKPNLEQIDDNFIKDIVSSLLKSDLLANIDSARIYKEYEFIYDDINIKRHGIIDLMLEYDDYIDIIDYKLKNIEDEAYFAQLQGYFEYIKKITNKKVNVYLYSLMDKKYKKLDVEKE